MRKLGRITAAGLILVFLLTSTALYAGWIDDWYSEATHTGPMSYKGQKRGYATAGSWSYRWNPPNDYPVSFSLPRIQAGCGGIDIFMGGMSFADIPQYLVQKFQAIIAEAPAVAFQVALSTLNEQLKDAMSDVEKATDFLNSLQIDDCSIAHSLVDEPAEKAAKAVGQFATTSIIGFGQEVGRSSLYTGMKTDIEGLTTTDALNEAGAGSDGSNAISSCPGDIKDMLSCNVSVLYYLLGHKRGYGQDIIEFVRGLVGDVAMASDKITAKNISPCPENKPTEGLETFVTMNGVKKRLSDDSCQPVTSIIINGHSYSSIRDWTEQMLAQLTDHMKNRTPITAGSPLDTFISTVPTPVYIATQVAVMEQSDDSLEGPLADLVSKAVMWKILNDLYSEIDYSLAKADEIITNKQGGSDSTHCKPMGLVPLAAGLQRIKNNLAEYRNMASRDYQSSLSAFVEMEQKDRSLMEARKNLHSLLANAFSGSMADRVMKSK